MQNTLVQFRELRQVVIEHARSMKKLRIPKKSTKLHREALSDFIN